MKKSSSGIIIAIIAILAIVGIFVGVYFATKSDGGSGFSFIASNGSSSRSGSILDRLRAEQEAGLYDRKKEDKTAAEEATA